jgi:L-arabinose transport system ATP-binding protein
VTVLEPSSPVPAVEFRSVSKTFPGVRALGDVSFAVRPGEVRALIGENGAGKSTLLKVLSGVHSPDAGSVVLDGRDRVFGSTWEALDAGVAVIYQELQLVPEMSVAENLYLGHLPSRLGIVDRRRLHEAARGDLERLGEEIDPAVKVGRLPIAQRQMVEIAKALTRGARVLALDEPTSSLSSREVERLFATVAELKRNGCAVLYVTHRMDELFRVCDSATVLRDGRHVKTFLSLEGVSHDLLVNRMVGRDIEDVFDYRPSAREETALEAVGVEGPGLSRPASFTVAKGEVVGLFGLIGAGRSELLRLVFGAEPMRAGAVKVDGRQVRISSPNDSIRSGVAFCPEDRKKDGIVPTASVLENLNLVARGRTARLGFVVDDSWEKRNAQDQVERLGIRTPSVAQKIVNLSGGNQQKTILARWLSEEVTALLLDEPTRGVDVGAKSEIYTIIRDLADRGVGVVLASSDLPEAIGVADRLLVMREGAVVASIPRGEADEEEVLRLALPASPDSGIEAA